VPRDAARGRDGDEVKLRSSREGDRLPHRLDAGRVSFDPAENA
jgi:hypothetical protein